MKQLDAKRVLARLDQMRSARMPFATHWQEVADYLLPSREFTRANLPGSRRVTRIYHTGPVTALDMLASGLHGMLTSPALRWFRLRADRGSAVDQPDDDVASWFETATEALYAVFNSQRSGFNAAAHEVYLEAAGFGNGVLFLEDGGLRGPLFVSVPLTECYIALDQHGGVDTLFRSWQMTARQILDTWPGSTPPKVREQAEKMPETRHEVVHAVMPSDGKPHGFSSIYVMRECVEDVLSRGGFRRFPYVFTRWERRSGEDYGSGPGMKMLPDIRLINKMEEINLRGLAKVVDPAVFVPDDGFLGPVQTLPNSINYFRAGTLAEGDRPFTLPNAARPEVAHEYMEGLMARIRSGCYVDWINLPTRPNMTATEVLQRRDEQLRLLGPVVARLQQELLGPLIDWTLETLLHNGFIPPAPEGIAAYEVEYQSPLALSQKASDADAVIRWATSVAQLAQVAPDALDVLDGGQAARSLADHYGVSPKIVRSMEEAAKVAQHRAEQQQAAQQVEAMGTLAGAAKDGAAAMSSMQPAAQGQGAPA